MINTGTGSIKDPERAKRIRLTNLMALMVFTTGTPFSVIFYLYGSTLSGILLIFYISLFWVVFLFNSKKQFASAKIVMLIVMNTAVIHYSIWYGAESAIHRMLIPFGCIPFLIFNRKNYGLITTFTSISFASYLVLEFTPYKAVLNLDALSLNIVYHGITLIFVTWVILEMLYLSNQNFQAMEMLS